SKPGAWLIRNSWGAYDGSDDGCFWMSYEQGLHGGAAYTVEKVNENMRTYDWDDLGWSSTWGYARAGVETKAANVFQIRSNGERVTEVGFYTTGFNAKVEVSVLTYADKPESPDIEDGTTAATASGTYPLPGYHTLKLSGNGVPVDKGEYFSVILKVTNGDDNRAIAIETARRGITDNAVVNSGESYFYGNATGKWFDGARYYYRNSAGDYYNYPMNACIKAFTVDTNPSDKADNDKNYYELDTLDGIQLTGYPELTVPSADVATANENSTIEGTEITVVLVSNDGNPVKAGTEADVYFVYDDFIDSIDIDAENDLADDESYDILIEEITSTEPNPFYPAGYVPDRFFVDSDDIIYPVYGPLTVTTAEGGRVSFDVLEELLNGLYIPEGNYNLVYSMNDTAVRGEIAGVEISGIPSDDKRQPDNRFWNEDEEIKPSTPDAPVNPNNPVNPVKPDNDNNGSTGTKTYGVGSVGGGCSAGMLGAFALSLVFFARKERN
ncbi:MAG: hypothetical protein IJ587_11205, partial [Synergistaceae bacterium]|nr:hypothetical protein [Synergistaceae bacterium]